MIASVFFWPSSLNRDKEAPEFPGSSNPELSDPSLSLALFQILKYSKNDIQRILKTIVKAKPLLACCQDPKTFKDPPKLDLKPKASDIYNSKLHMDCYDFI